MRCPVINTLYRNNHQLLYYNDELTFVALHYGTKTGETIPRSFPINSPKYLYHVFVLFKQHCSWTQYILTLLYCLLGCRAARKVLYWCQFLSILSMVPLVCFLSFSFASKILHGVLGLPIFCLSLGVQCNATLVCNILSFQLT